VLLSICFNSNSVVTSASLSEICATLSAFVVVCYTSCIFVLMWWHLARHVTEFEFVFEFGGFRRFSQNAKSGRFTALTYVIINTR